MSARRRARGSATVEYVGALVAVGVLMLGLVAVREHRPQRRPPVDPVGHVGALVAPVRVPRVRRPAATGSAPAPAARPAPAPPGGARPGVGGGLVMAAPLAAGPPRGDDRARTIPRRG